jgi:hypothetical protein
MWSGIYATGLRCLLSGNIPYPRADFCVVVVTRCERLGIECEAKATAGLRRPRRIRGWDRYDGWFLRGLV